MAQGHNVTKRNRRQISGKRGHIGRATQLALRSPEATALADQQDREVLDGKLRLLLEAKHRREARDAKRAAMRKA